MAKSKATKSVLRTFTTPFLFFSEFAETEGTYGMTFHQYLTSKWLKKSDEVEEITPLQVNAKGKVKFLVTYYTEVPNVKGPLPKNFWSTVENYLPDYYSREDVAECSDLEKMRDDGDKMTVKQKARLESLNRRLYKEACKVAATID